MKKQTGIWLDNEETSIFTLKTFGHKLDTIASNIITRAGADDKTKAWAIC